MFVCEINVEILRYLVPWMYDVFSHTDVYLGWSQTQILCNLTYDEPV